ncbi:hypothetical protein [Psychrobacter sp. P11G3]|uniref:hypothetical protein n=1 Tax=Psychrobacter sp. P11G3 TaxID=1699623 RepID=UPI00070B1660|nr:hypothetical protein [Psychrobacter sp. P11G3]KRG35761.1 hypothetical protein AK824_00655 [Psychrobacter sp. P11G3]
MNCDINSIFYNGKSLSVEVYKNSEVDFAFYVLMGDKKLDSKWYSFNDISILNIPLEPKITYSLILFFRPRSEKTKEDEKIVRKFFFKIDTNGNSSIINEEVLHETEFFKISEYNQDSDTTFITFNSAHTDKSSDPFGGGFILSQGWNLISVRKHNRNPYQELSLQNFKDIVGPKVSQKKVFTYGTSLGGYSSIYYGGVVNATIIAGAPKLSLITNSNIRYRHIEYKHISIKDTIKSINPVYIIYDPLVSGDVNFIKKHILSGYPQAKFLPVKGGTHLVIKKLLEKGIIKDTIIDLVNNNIFEATNRIITS